MRWSGNNGNKTCKDISCIVVLGMHRSGTSSLAGSLQEMQVYLGDASKCNPYNRKGNRENQLVVDLNEQLLFYNKASWDEPPLIRRRLKWTDEQAVLRDQFICDMRSAATGKQMAFWGFKDPRTLITWPFWAEALPFACLVGTFRDPIAVAASLHKRDGMPPEKAYKLWFDYNQRLLKIYRAKPFKLFNFDSPVELYNRDIAAFAIEHGVPSAENSFFEEHLRSNDCKDEKNVPWKVTRLYAKLQRLYIREAGK